MKGGTFHLCQKSISFGGIKKGNCFLVWPITVFFSVGKEYHDQKYSKILFVLLKLTENDSTILFSHSFLVPWWKYFLSVMFGVGSFFLIQLHLGKKVWSVQKTCTFDFLVQVKHPWLTLHRFIGRWTCCQFSLQNFFYCICHSLEKAAREEKLSAACVRLLNFLRS